MANKSSKQKSVSSYEYKSNEKLLIVNEIHDNDIHEQGKYLRTSEICLSLGEIHRRFDEDNKIHNIHLLFSA